MASWAQRFLSIDDFLAPENAGAETKASQMRRPQRKFGKAIGARSARKLIREIGGSSDYELVAEWERVIGHPPLSRPEQDIVRLKDGRILWIFYNSTNIYTSIDEFRALLAHVDQTAHKMPQHPLAALFPRGRGFIEGVPQLVQELPRKLHLGANALNGGVKSLDYIDKATRHLGGPEILEDPPILASIVAYVGEVMRKATDGRWAIRNGEGPDADLGWQAVIVGANGRDYPVFVIFKELLESGSVRAVVSAMIIGQSFMGC